jgi:hypothetical protein
MASFKHFPILEKAYGSRNDSTPSMTDQKDSQSQGQVGGGSQSPLHAACTREPAVGKTVGAKSKAVALC